MPTWKARVNDRTQVQRSCPCRGGCPLIYTKAPTNLLDTLHSRICLITHTACELWLLFRVLAEGGVLGHWSPCLLLRLLLSLVAALGSLPMLAFCQPLLLQAQCRL